MSPREARPKGLLTACLCYIPAALYLALGVAAFAACIFGESASGDHCLPAALVAAPWVFLLAVFAPLPAGRWSGWSLLFLAAAINVILLLCWGRLAQRASSCSARNSNDSSS